MNYIAKIEGGIVVRVMVADDQCQPSEDCVMVGPENTVGIGWAYEGGEFVPPEQLIEDSHE